MEQIKKLEQVIGKWLKPLPHLPIAWRKWLGDNVWWLTIISAVISAYSVYGIYQAATVVNYYSNLLVAYGVTSSNGWTVSMTVSIILLALTTAIMISAVTPLKEHKRKGWDLLFLASLISVSSGLVSQLVSLNVGGVIGGLLGAAIGAVISMYFLYEIRSQFSGATIIK